MSGIKIYSIVLIDILNIISSLDICITFTENTYIHGDKIEEYKVRRNKLILSSGEKYEITLTKHYLLLYVKRF